MEASYVLVASTLLTSTVCMFLLEAWEGGRAQKGGKEKSAEKEREERKKQEQRGKARWVSSS